MRRRSLLPAVLTACTLLVAACGDDDGEAVREIGGTATGSESASGVASGSDTGSGSGSGTASCVPVGDLADAEREVDVELGEFYIKAPLEVQGGAVGFVAKNVGEEVHELVIVQGVSSADLPRTGDGGLDEDALPEGALIGEIEGFPAGQTCSGVFELEPGDYALVCNIVETEDNGEIEAHLALGMQLDITVT